VLRIACIAVLVATVVATKWRGATARCPNLLTGQSRGVSTAVSPAIPVPIAPIPPPDLNPVLLWLAITLALPLVSMTFLRSVVRRRSNVLNAGTALLYLTIELLAATPFAPTTLSLMSGLAWSTLVAFSVLYTLGSMNFALHLES
jgi:hypothetical protein